jgi:radical SAM-linked protein
VSKVRFWFAKRGDLRLVSHHDLLRTLERALRRARLPVAYSQGYSPRPKCSFALALALGVEGRREVLDIEFSQELDCLQARQRLAAALPAGFDIIDAAPLVAGDPKMPIAARYHLKIPPHLNAAAHENLSAFLERAEWPYLRCRAERSTPFDLRPHVQDAALDPHGLLCFKLAINPAGSARPEEFVEALGLRAALDQGEFLVRVDLEWPPREHSPPPNQKLRPQPHELPVEAAAQSPS